MEAGAGVPKWLACKGQHASIRAGSAIRSGIGVLTFLEAQQCLLHNGASCIATVMITIAFWHTLSTISDHARTISRDAAMIASTARPGASEIYPGRYS